MIPFQTESTIIFLIVLLLSDVTLSIEATEPLPVQPWSSSHETNLTYEEKELEKEIFRHLEYKKHYIDGGVLSEDDLICNCTVIGCDHELITMVGPDYRGLCRARKGNCLASVRLVTTSDGTKKREEHLDCLNREHMLPEDRPFKCYGTAYVATACCNQSFCSASLNLTAPADVDIHSPVHDDRGFHWRDYLFIGIIFFIVPLLLFVSVCFIQWISPTCRNYLLKLYHSTGRPDPAPVTQGDDERPMLETQATLSTLLRDLESTNSGSGSGLPLLIQRTIALQIELKEDIGQGRFGEVKLGIWRGENVAVKIFSSRDERSFNREVEIYNTLWLRHSNILQFIASDRKDTGVATELWLITEYHSYGSLYDYLQKETVEEQTAVQMIRSFSNGMQFLHSEIPGQHNKPAIAHRDIKSKNILVKRDLTCVIADLGLAVRYENGQLNIPDNSKCGTVRYLAPELLDDTMVTRRFESYRMADMYAFGLVMWEIGRRSRSEAGPPSDFEEAIPYFEYVSRDPTIQDVLQVVAIENRRPSYSTHWKNSSILNELYRVMGECWRSTPSSRLTAMNVRIAMDRVARHNNMHLLT